MKFHTVEREKHFVCPFYVHHASWQQCWNGPWSHPAAGLGSQAAVHGAYRRWGVVAVPKALTSVLRGSVAVPCTCICSYGWVLIWQWAGVGGRKGGGGRPAPKAGRGSGTLSLRLWAGTAAPGQESGLPHARAGLAPQADSSCTAPFMCLCTCKALTLHFSIILGLGQSFIKFLVHD